MISPTEYQFFYITVKKHKVRLSTVSFRDLVEKVAGEPCRSPEHSLLAEELRRLRWNVSEANEQGE